MNDISWLVIHNAQTQCKTFLSSIYKAGMKHTQKIRTLKRLAQFEITEKTLRLLKSETFPMKQTVTCYTNECNRRRKKSRTRRNILRKKKAEDHT